MDMDYERVPSSDQHRAVLTKTSVSTHSTPCGLGLQTISDVSLDLRTVPVGTPRFVPTPPQAASPQSSGSAFSQASTSRAIPLKSPEAMSYASTLAERDSFPGFASCYNSDVDLLKSNRKDEITVGCPTEGDVLTSPWSVLTVTILLLAFYSTILSGIFFGIACAQPRWGLRIGTPGRISYRTATLLSALLSKTIELSFVSVFVALLGQILSRRAFSKRTRRGRGQGISISEMSMRIWVMQPGSLITHWESIRFSGWTFLGILALLATFSATFYTTAAEALVAPKLTLGTPKSQVLGGLVVTDFSNNTYFSQQCKTPVTDQMDPLDRGSTCRQIDYAGQSYRDFSTWLENWQSLSTQGNDSFAASMDGRPVPSATLYENTTVAGQWIKLNAENITADSARHGRFVHNVTMAMPHANIFNAVRNPMNSIPQPEDFLGQGEYEINGSLPSLALNVLCVGLSSNEVAPLVINDTEVGPVPPTAVDALFNFGDNAGQQKPAQFLKIPEPFNTVFSGEEGYGPEATYLLATPPPEVADDYHVMCSMKALKYANCATRYSASDTGGYLAVHCDDHLGDMQSYKQAEPLAPTSVIEYNWHDLSILWMWSTALTHGQHDADAAIARLVTQFIAPYDADMPVELNPALPSVAEALAVLGANTLVKGTLYAPFVHFWNYTTDIQNDPQIQYFNASVRYKDFSSGINLNQQWQGIFFVVLFLVFAINLYALIFLVKNVVWDGQVTDYTEPENLFAIANLSPPSASLHGACGGGPRGNMLNKKWRVDMRDLSQYNHPEGHRETEYSPHSPLSHDVQKQHPHFYFKCIEDETELLGWRAAEGAVLRNRKQGDRNKKKSRPRSVQDWISLSDVESPALEQYRRLAD